MKSTTLFLGALFASTLPLAAAHAGIRSRRWFDAECGSSAYADCSVGHDHRRRFLFSAVSVDSRVTEKSNHRFDPRLALNFHASQKRRRDPAPYPSTSESSEQFDSAKFSPGQSTAFGQHTVEWTLAMAPVAAFALSPIIDRRLHYQDNGIWQRKRQLDFEYAVILGEVGGSLWFGGQSRIGKTFWRSMDASLYTAITVQGMKYIFSRARPRQSSSPDHWFQGGCCQSFPSGEVSFQASAVTPFIAEYHKEYPWVWALEALPAYDALARMKAHGHWQTDVLAAWAIGTAWGIYAHDEPKPLILSIMPHGILVGIHTSF